MGDMKTRLESQELIVEVAAHGGELIRIYD